MVILLSGFFVQKNNEALALQPAKTGSCKNLNIT